VIFLFRTAFAILAFGTVFAALPATTYAACRPGWVPASDKTGALTNCMPLGFIDCGRGTSCTPDNKCQPGFGCMEATDIYCGGYSCPRGSICSGGGRCQGSGFTGEICSMGLRCRAGNLCGPDGWCYNPIKTFFCGSHRCLIGASYGSDEPCGICRDNHQAEKKECYRPDGTLNDLGQSVRASYKAICDAIPGRGNCSDILLRGDEFDRTVNKMVYSLEARTKYCRDLLFTHARNKFCLDARKRAADICPGGSLANEAHRTEREAVEQNMKACLEKFNKPEVDCIGTMSH
jgi:hypothetical protein